MLRLLVWIINTGKVLQLARVSDLAGSFQIALATDIKGTLHIDLNEIADLLTCQRASFAVGRGGSGNANYTVACEQATHKGDTLDVGIAIFATNAKPFAQMCTYDITIEYLDLDATLSEPLFEEMGNRALASARKPGEPVGVNLPARTVDP